jgi:hypothetical protein
MCRDRRCSLACVFRSSLGPQCAGTEDALLRVCSGVVSAPNAEAPSSKGRNLRFSYIDFLIILWRVRATIDRVWLVIQFIEHLQTVTITTALTPIATLCSSLQQILSLLSPLCPHYVLTAACLLSLLPSQDSSELWTPRLSAISCQPPAPLTYLKKNPSNSSQVKSSQITLRPAASRPVRLGVGPPLGPITRF